MLEKLEIFKFSIDFNFWVKKALDQDPESGIWIQIQIRIKIKPWIRIRINAYADPKHCTTVMIYRCCGSGSCWTGSRSTKLFRKNEQVRCAVKANLRGLNIQSHL